MNFFDKKFLAAKNRYQLQHGVAFNIVFVTNCV